jgi:hypothetical protein
MLITNFTTGRDDLYVLWDGKTNRQAWTELRSVPDPYLDLARSAKRVQVDTKSHKKLSRTLVKQKTRTVK